MMKLNLSRLVTLVLFSVGDAAIRANPPKLQEEHASIHLNDFPFTNKDVLSCPRKKPYAQIHGVSSIKNEYLNRMKMVRKRYMENLGPGTFQEPRIEKLWQGTFCLRGFVETGVLEMHVFNWKRHLKGETRLAGSGVWRYTEPKNLKSSFPKTMELTGDRVVYVGPRFGVFGHFYLDNLTYIAYLKDTMPPTMRFLLADTRKGTIRSILQDLDPEFYDRVDWLVCSSEVKCRTKVRIKEGHLILVQPRSGTRHMDLFYRARQWILQRHPPNPHKPRTVLFYTRNAHSVFHGRVMDLEQEAKMLQLIETNLHKHGRQEKLVVFDGSGSTLEQMQLFQSANFVIGPHGSGLSNLIFTLPATSCEHRPKILEFITSPLTPDVQFGEMLRTDYYMFSTAPWLEYHHIFVQPPSGEHGMFVDMNEFEHALQTLFLPAQQQQQFRI